MQQTLVDTGGVKNTLKRKKYKATVKQLLQLNLSVSQATLSTGAWPYLLIKKWVYSVSTQLCLSVFMDYDKGWK